MKIRFEKWMNEEGFELIVEKKSTFWLQEKDGQVMLNSGYRCYDDDQDSYSVIDSETYAELSQHYQLVDSWTEEAEEEEDWE